MIWWPGVWCKNMGFEATGFHHGLRWDYDSQVFHGRKTHEKKCFHGGFYLNGVPRVILIHPNFSWGFSLRNHPASLGYRNTKGNPFNKPLTIHSAYFNHVWNHHKSWLTILNQDLWKPLPVDVWRVYSFPFFCGDTLLLKCSWKGDLGPSWSWILGWEPLSS